MQNQKLNIMAQSLSMQSEKKLITIDITSDTVCDWCFIGKRHLNKAMDASKDLYNFRVVFSSHFFQFSCLFLVSILLVEASSISLFSLVINCVTLGALFQVRWHPFLLNPSAPKEGIEKTVYWKQKFGDENVEPIISRVSKVDGMLFLNNWCFIVLLI
jgi:predicted DsbA family dithiol-disulfide isomerase